MKTYNVQVHVVNVQVHVVNVQVHVVNVQVHVVNVLVHVVITEYPTIRPVEESLGAISCSVFITTISLLCGVKNQMNLAV